MGNGVASRGERWFLAVAGLVTLLAVGFAVRQPWSSDLGVHAATIERLRENLIHPGNPLVDEPGTSPYYSPYPVLLAVLARATGLAPVTLLAIAGPLIVVALVAGLRGFVRTLSDNPLAPALAVGFALVLWGLQPRVWSGFFALWGLPFIAAFPSTLALALTLWLWTGVTRALDASRSPVWLALLGLLAGLVTLVHPFTAVTAGLGVAALVAARLPRLTRRSWLGLAAFTAACVGAIAAWPYYSFTALLPASKELDTIHRALYDRPWLFYGLLCVALPALWCRLRRYRLDPLALMFVAALLIVTIGWFTGRYALGRVWPAVALSAQLALAVELTGPLPARVVRRWAPVVALASVLGLVAQSSNLLYLLPDPLVPQRIRVLTHMYVKWPAYSWLAAYTTPRDVVLTNDFYAVRTVGAYGLYTIAPAWPDPLLPDEARRRQDLLVLFRRGTDPATRVALLSRYHVRWILAVPGRWAPVDGDPLVATGPDGQRLYRVPLPVTRAG